MDASISTTRAAIVLGTAQIVGNSLETIEKIEIIRGLTREHISFLRFHPLREFLGTTSPGGKGMSREMPSQDQMVLRDQSVRLDLGLTELLSWDEEVEQGECIERILFLARDNKLVLWVGRYLGSETMLKYSALHITHMSNEDLMALFLSQKGCFLEGVVEALRRLHLKAIRSLEGQLLYAREEFQNVRQTQRRLGYVPQSIRRSASWYGYHLPDNQ